MGDHAIRERNKFLLLFCFNDIHAISMTEKKRILEVRVWSLRYLSRWLLEELIKDGGRERIPVWNENGISELGNILVWCDHEPLGVCLLHSKKALNRYTESVLRYFKFGSDVHGLTKIWYLL